MCGSLGGIYAEGVGQLQPRVSYPGIKSLDIGQTLKEFARERQPSRPGQSPNHLFDGERWRMLLSKSRTLSELSSLLSSDPRVEATLGYNSPTPSA